METSVRCWCVAVALYSTKEVTRSLNIIILREVVELLFFIFSKDNFEFNSESSFS